MRFSISSCALFALLLGAASGRAQTPSGQPAQRTPCGQPGQQPCPRQQQQQPGQYPQQQQYPQRQQYPQQGQYPQGQYPQQGPYQRYQQPGQYRQQPGYWQQQPGQWQAPPPPKKHKHKTFESTLGVMLRLGGNLWTTPDNIEPAGYDALGFAGNAGGFGLGGALYYEARIEQYFGLELDFGYDHSNLHRDLDYVVNNVPFKLNESVTASGVRWGLIAKAIAPLRGARLWLGIGPEFVSGSSVDGNVDITSGTPSKALRSEFENSIHETSKHSTMLDLAFGVVAEIGDHVDIPIELRAARNLSQARNWKDRVDTTKLTAHPRSYNVTVQSSWDFRLGLGLGYRF